MYKLRFKDEQEMLEVLGSVPHSTFGPVRVRGELGECGQYEDTGERNEDGEPIMRELVAPVVYEGYFVEMACDTALPAELTEYEVK